jgi:hypothetical protein
MRTDLTPVTEPSALGSDPSWVEYFRWIQAYFHELPCSSKASYSIAETAIRLHFGSELFRQQVAHAFGHLEGVSKTGPELTVLLHDLGSAPRAAEFLEAFNPPGEEADMWLMDSPDLMLILQRPRRVFAAVDWRSNCAYWLIPDAESIPYLERARPLKLLLTYWMAMKGRHLIHAAAVGNEQGGVLIVGQSGAGKSTTALSCLKGGLEYAADDHCLIRIDGSPSVHSIYGTGVLAAEDLHRFPSFGQTAATGDCPAGEKVALFFDRDPTIRISARFSLRSILLAEVTGSRRSTVRRISAGEAFKAIAPSCFMHLPITRPQALACFNSLVRQLPAYKLELGSDLNSGPTAIVELLDRCCDSEVANYGNKCHGKHAD